MKLNRSCSQHCLVHVGVPSFFKTVRVHLSLCQKPLRCHSGVTAAVVELQFPAKSPLRSTSIKWVITFKVKVGSLGETYPAWGEITPHYNIMLWTLCACFLHEVEFNFYRLYVVVHQTPAGNRERLLHLWFYAARRLYIAPCWKKQRRQCAYLWWKPQHVGHSGQCRMMFCPATPSPDETAAMIYGARLAGGSSAGSDVSTGPGRHGRNWVTHKM